MSFIFVTAIHVHGQPAGTTNFYGNIKTYNLAALWHADHLRLLSLKENEPFPEPYGILGKNCQRFYIHYTSVVKDPANPYRYQVQGKTRVGNQVRPFTGTITVTQAGIYKPGSQYAPDTYKGYKRGKLICRVTLNESGSTPQSGVIDGELTADFCINAQNQLFYDTLDFGIDGYQNNQFMGTWTAHGSKASQKLQYGDFNLNDSAFGDVDGINVPPQYEKYGWQSFVNSKAWDGKPISKTAVAEEKRQWWK
ncbi:hypothetical protein [Mucilaginibacter lacusdianchii]|uniref:hypothetical protein n=1 Tax=Mucilaginibacter lacusdianchii TaxID=2684211 RepID=UPI00131B8066|nr:hypothetical protein [Mucilaginibacter sp. JXJ CY 39]